MDKSVKIESDRYTATMDRRGVVDVHMKGERSATKVRHEGRHTFIEKRPLKDVFPSLAGCPVLRLAFAGQNEWHTDIECGVQRWHGYRPNQIIRHVFKGFGFSKEQIDTILHPARKHVHNYLGRVI